MKWKKEFLKPILWGLIFIILGGVAYGIDNPLTMEPTDDELYFTLLHTNDEHSSLIPHTSTTDNNQQFQNPSKGGYSRLATAIKNIRKKKEQENEEVLLVSSGDFIGGTAFSWLVPKGLAPELKVMHEIGYNAITIGNHEFDYGTEVLIKYLKKAGYPERNKVMPVLATNIQVDSKYPLSNMGLFKKYHIMQLKNGLRIGFFSLLGKNATTVALNTNPITFKDQRKTAERAVKYLESQNVDIVIALSHSGVVEDKKLVKKVKGIDIIVGGHSHTALFEPIKVEDTIIVQADSYLKYLGILELVYDQSKDAVGLRNKEKPYLIPIDSSISNDFKTTNVIEKYTIRLNQYIGDITHDEFNNILDVIARSDFPIRTEMLKESSLGNFVTDAMRLITGEKLGEPVDVAIQANGSIRGSLIPGSMDYSKGLISFYDLASLVGLGYGSDDNAGYPIVSFYLTGEEIYKALEVAALMAETLGDNYFLQFSGLRYDYNPRDAVLFKIPFKNTPIPSTRAVKEAEIYGGLGVQSEDGKDYFNLKRKDDRLYHVVTDSYILSFLPMAGELLPQLDIVPKDKRGNPVPMEEFEKLTVYENGSQLKVWKAVVEYAASQAPDKDGVPLIPKYYKSQGRRINIVSTIPIILWPVLGLVVIGMILLPISIKKLEETRENF